MQLDIHILDSPAGSSMTVGFQTMAPIRHGFIFGIILIIFPFVQK